MFDPKLYRDACRELKAPEDKIEEIIAMTEKTNQKTRRPLRAALIAAAVAAFMVVGVAAANPELPGELWYRVLDIVQVGQYRSEMVTEDGETITLMSLPETKVEKRDGRAILTLNGEDEADITDALNELGRYEYEKTDEGARLVITVTGNVNDWSLTASLGDPDSDDLGAVGYVNSSDLEKEKAGSDGNVDN